MKDQTSTVACGVANEPSEATHSMAQDATNAHMRSTMGATSGRSPRRRIKVTLLVHQHDKLSAVVYFSACSMLADLPKNAWRGASEIYVNFSGETSLLS